MPCRYKNVYYGGENQGMSGILVPGTLVQHSERPDWGIGQVQSAIGNRITVTFEHAGKRLILADKVKLIQPTDRVS